MLIKYWKQFTAFILGIFAIGGVYAALPDIPDIAKEKMAIAYEQSSIKAKYKMENASFIMEAIDENAMQTEIGDKTADKFSPEMTLRKWSDECNFKIKYKHNEKEKDLKFELDGEKIKLKGKKIETHFYEMENENYEFEIILLEKPDMNIVSFDIETKGLNFYYQPELTQEEIDDGAIRPENVIGSYAVYHESKQGDYSKMDGKNYMAGKAFHIFRPLIIDNAGTEIWGELNIIDNLLIVEIPQEFLDNAVYPVKHAAGLTFGYITIGGTIDADFANGRITSYRFAGAVGTATSITAYVDAGTGDDAAYGIYKNSDLSRVGYTGSVEIAAGFNWFTANIISGGSLLAEDYQLAFQFNDSAWGSDIKYDTGTAGYAISDNNYRTPFTWPDPMINSSTDNKKYSIYCTYTAGEAEEEALNKQDILWFD